MDRFHRHYSADLRRSTLPMQAGSFLPMKDNPTSAQVLAGNIKWLLAHHKMEVATLSERAEVSLRTLHDIRNADNPNPRLETIESIARVFRLSPADLLDPLLPESDDLRGEANHVRSVYMRTSSSGRELIDKMVGIAESQAFYAVHNQEDGEKPRD